MALVYVKRDTTIKLFQVLGLQTIPVKAVLTPAKDAKILCPAPHATL